MPSISARVVIFHSFGFIFHENSTLPICGYLLIKGHHGGFSAFCHYPLVTNLDVALY